MPHQINLIFITGKILPIMARNRSRTVTPENVRNKELRNSEGKFCGVRRLLEWNILHVFETAVRRVYVTYDEVSFRTQPCSLEEWSRWKKSEGITCMSLQREKRWLHSGQEGGSVEFCVSSLKGENSRNWARRETQSLETARTDFIESKLFRAFRNLTCLRSFYTAAWL